MIRRAIVLFVTAVAVWACDRPRNIPDATLVDITHDLFLANAYASPQGPKGLLRDTLDYYTPIFKHYGYKPSDFSYTIANLSRRKSIRFSDILDIVVLRLEAENARLVAEVALMDTIDQRLAERYKQVVYRDSLRHLTQLRKADDPDVSIPVTQGHYRIDFVYDLDTSNRNGNLRYTHYITDSTTHYNFDYRNLGYVKGKHKRESIEFDVNDQDSLFLNICFATSTAIKEKRIDLDIDSIRITRYLPVQIARDSLIREVRYNPAYSYKIIDDVAGGKKIIGPFYPDPSRMVARGDSVVRR